MKVRDKPVKKGWEREKNEPVYSKAAGGDVLHWNTAYYQGCVQNRLLLAT